MKCPNCGSEIEDGKLLCSVCGTEIQYVPDYEPELEDSLDSTIHIIKDEITGDGQEDKKTKFNQKYPIASKVIIGFILLAIFGIVFFTIRYTQDHSFDYQYQKAISYAEENDYGQAINSLEKAIALDEENIDLIKLKAEYYTLYGFRDTSKSILENAIVSGHDTLEIYEILISYYMEESNYSAIVSLITNTSNSLVYEKYKHYISLPPRFSSAPGVFYNKISLELLSNGSGAIYYTLDGTVPTESSERYKGPLYLEEGEYQINAVFINDVGVLSDLISGTFTIDLSKPFAPDVNVYSGVTSRPEAIVIDVQENCQVLYSLDGSDITENSFRYSGPIAMPIGSFTLRCVTINEDLEMSNETTRVIEFIIPGEITVLAAEQISYQELVTLGRLVNENGELADKDGYNSYTTNSAFTYENNPYFLIYEWYTDIEGNTKKTGNLFGVQMLTGEFTNVAFDDEGNYRIY